MDQTPHRNTPIALAVAAALWTGTTTGSAAERASEPFSPAVEELSPIVVQGERLARPSSPKYTASLTDTPQSITVVTRETIAEQNMLSLRDILSTVPGITFGAGEGGGGYGDSINLRGFSGSADISIDGFRDSAQYTRSDPFNLEQVEVVNGANSVYAGAGSVGGTINLVSKTASVVDSTQLTLGSGAGGYSRITGDINRVIGDSSAVRLNVMGHRNDVPGRDVERSRRYGVAPSIAYGLGTATQLSFSMLHQHDNNIPEYGVPTWDGQILPGVDRSSYFGYSNVDRQINDTTGATLAIRHRFSDQLSLHSQTRWQQTDQLSRVNPPQGTFCLANGLSPTNPSAANPLGGMVACSSDFLPDQYQPSGPRGTTRDTRNQIVASQTDLRTEFATGSLDHTLVIGFSLTRESYRLLNGNSVRNPDGSSPLLPRTSISDPDHVYAGPLNFIISSRTDGTLDNRAAYVFDNVRLTDRWSFNGGLRLEHHEDKFAVVHYATPADGGGITPDPPGGNTESLVSYRAGLVFKPVNTASIYLAFGNSRTPSVASVNGTCTVSGNNSNCNLQPETARNLELGTKWELANQRLSISAAVARNERTHYRVPDPGNPDNPSGEQVLDGSARVDSLLLGVAGRIRPNWSVFANYTYLDSEVLQGASDFISAQGQDYTRGDPLLNVPRHAASLWTTWDVTRLVQLGYGMTWQGKVYISQHTAADGAFPTGSALPYVGGYATHRAMASYTVNGGLHLQLNVNNIFDKEYLTRVRTRRLAWATPGEARSVVLSANFTFR